MEILSPSNALEGECIGVVGRGMHEIRRRFLVLSDGHWSLHLNSTPSTFIFIDSKVKTQPLSLKSEIFPKRLLAFCVLAVYAGPNLY
ncbi:hypothetical protein CEXT_499911 [Caerostris extrusa]|uniref:Uncharacterized protein n=1 Tax=Caerostris extrusa TaxID=172846 RepID=A0AAV4U2J2_CAEEX|nr:hypothetical protein CEXT_499911 [Caerostris extrusa]